MRFIRSNKISEGKRNFTRRRQRYREWDHFWIVSKSKREENESKNVVVFSLLNVQRKCLLSGVWVINYFVRFLREEYFRRRSWVAPLLYSKFRTSFPHSFFCEKSTPQLTFYNKILFAVRRHWRVTHNKNLFPLFSRFHFFFSRTYYVILDWRYVCKFFRAYDRYFQRTLPTDNRRLKEEIKEIMFSWGISTALARHTCQRVHQKTNTCATQLNASSHLKLRLWAKTVNLIFVFFFLWLLPGGTKQMCLFTSTE